MGTGPQQERAHRGHRVDKCLTDEGATELDREEARANERLDRIDKFVEQRKTQTPLLCRHGKRMWSGSDPICAFDFKGNFMSENWNCRLLNSVAFLVSPDNDGKTYKKVKGKWVDAKQKHAVFPYQYNDDQYAGLIPIKDSGVFALISRYKIHGRVDGFWILDNNLIREGTEADAKMILRLYDKRKLRTIEQYQKSK